MRLLQTVPTPLSNTFLDTGPPPFVCYILVPWCHRMEIFQDILLSFTKKNDTKNRKGINAISPMIHFTIKSATASDNHNGESAPMVKNGTISHAQEISPFAASEKSGIREENAIVKKIVVSIKEARNDEIRGAFHHAAERNLLKTAISKN